MRRTIARAGLAAAVVYVITVAVGGVFVEDYSHLRQAVSEIAPLLRGWERVVIEALFGLYNVMVMLFGIALGRTIPGVMGRVITILLIAVGIAGIGMEVFPMDLSGTEPTVHGTVHLVLAGIVAPATIALTLLAGIGLGRTMPRYRLFSLIAGAVIVVSGPLAAAAAANGWVVTGLLERVTIGTFILWLAGTSLACVRRDSASA